MKELIYKEDAIKALGEEPMVWTDSDFELADRNRWEMDVEALKELQPVPQDEMTHEQFKEYCRKRCLSVVTNELVEEIHRMNELRPPVQPITHEQAIDYLHETGWLQSHDRILTEHEQMYKRAFSVACELLIGANLFGVTEETMFTEIMDKDGIVSSLGYERYILDNLARLTGEDDDID